MWWSSREQHVWHKLFVLSKCQISMNFINSIFTLSWLTNRLTRRSVDSTTCTSSTSSEWRRVWSWTFNDHLRRPLCPAKNTQTIEMFVISTELVPISFSQRLHVSVGLFANFEQNILSMGCLISKFRTVKYDARSIFIRNSNARKYFLFLNDSYGSQFQLHT